jgi:ABC-type dipeptide/oligopeptide/nickel transport system permease component
MEPKINIWNKKLVLTNVKLNLIILIGVMFGLILILSFLFFLTPKEPDNSIINDNTDVSAEQQQLILNTGFIDTFLNWFPLLIGLYFGVILVLRIMKNLRYF